MRLTAAVCTRNRPDLVAGAVGSILSNDHPDFDLVVIDQSRSSETRQLLKDRFGCDSRLRYRHAARVGVSPARNAAIAEASGEAIAFTDDDCVVPVDWLRKIDQVLTNEPDVDLLYGQVLVPAALVGLEGEIPALRLPAERRISRRDEFALCGMTANCAARRTMFERLAGFDELLGPGRELRSGEDFDLNYRAFQAGCLILLSPEIVVDHYGVRSPTEWVARLTEYGFGDAAFYLKHVRCRDLRLTWVLLCHLARQSARAVLRRPDATAYLQGFGHGVAASLRFDVNPETRLYIAR